MDIEDLRVFVEVAGSGGITSAARRLGVSKSMVSRALTRIEGALGTQLLARTTRGAGLTEAGGLFRDHAAKVCAEIDIAREAILPEGDLRGRFRVAVPLTSGPVHFAPVLAKMARHHPQLQIQADYSDRFADLIVDGFDCAIRVGALRDFESHGETGRPDLRQAGGEPGLYKIARLAGGAQRDRVPPGFGWCGDLAIHGRRQDHHRAAAGPLQDRQRHGACERSRRGARHRLAPRLCHP